MRQGYDNIVTIVVLNVLNDSFKSLILKVKPRQGNTINDAIHIEYKLLVLLSLELPLIEGFAI